MIWLINKFGRLSLTEKWCLKILHSSNVINHVYDEHAKEISLFFLNQGLPSNAQNFCGKRRDIWCKPIGPEKEQFTKCLKNIKSNGGIKGKSWRGWTRIKFGGWKISGRSARNYRLLARDFGCHFGTLPLNKTTFMKQKIMFCILLLKLLFICIRTNCSHLKRFLSIFQ